MLYWLHFVPFATQLGIPLLFHLCLAMTVGSHFIYAIVSSVVVLILVYDPQEQSAKADLTDLVVKTRSANSSNPEPPVAPVIPPNSSNANDFYESLGPFIQSLIFIILIVAFLLVPIIAMWFMAMEARTLLSVSQQMSPATNKVDDKMTSSIQTAPTKSVRSTRETSTADTDTTASKTLFKSKVEHVSSVKSNLKRTAVSNTVKNKKGAKSNIEVKVSPDETDLDSLHARSPSSNPLAVTSKKDE